MHDGGGNRDQDVEALPRILQTLKDQGYRFVTINELMAMDSRIPQGRGVRGRHPARGRRLAHRDGRDGVAEVATHALLGFYGRTRRAPYLL